MIDLTPFRYRTILVDVAWRYRLWSAAGEAKSPQAHYDCMALDDVKAMNVGHLAHPDGCVLVMWATAPMLPQAIETIAAWGFTYSTMGGWAKRSRTGASWTFGTGYRLRSACEPFLIATMNDPPIRSRATRNLIVAPVREHSRKPDEIYALAEAIGDAPRCELFARQRRAGWDSWGNQVDRFPVAEAAE